jgi:hypothetical protein
MGGGRPWRNRKSDDVRSCQKNVPASKPILSIGGGRLVLVVRVDGVIEMEIGVTDVLKGRCWAEESWQQ